jgi:hypothetical protein
VTHHVELVIPSAQYFVRMLDGRIDTQGTVTELQSRGLLDYIVLEAQAAEEPEVVTAEELAIVANTSDTDNTLLDKGTINKSRKPKKLVEDEARASGSVKWRVYKAYLQATSVQFNAMAQNLLTALLTLSGYFTWFLLIFILGLSQLGGVTEKVCLIMQSCHHY